MRIRFLAILLLLPLAACGNAAFDQAEACLARFHSALVRGDAGAVRAELTDSSKRFVQALPKRLDSANQPLRVVHKRRDHSRIYLEVRDDNPGAKNPEGTYVVVKSGGVWRIDLLATAGKNNHVVWNKGPAQRWVPAALTSKQRARAQRAVEASHRR